MRRCQDWANTKAAYRFLSRAVISFEYGQGLPDALAALRPPLSHGPGGEARRSITRYLTSMVVTLRAGNVIFSEVPLAVCVPIRTGCTGVCPWAEVAVI